MDVWMAWGKRKTKCTTYFGGCGKDILVGKPMIRGRTYRKRGVGAKKWVINVYWHPRCWVHQGFRWLRDHPYAPPVGVGRPKLQLNGDDRKARRRLLVKHSTIRYRQRQAAIAGNAVKVLSLEVQAQSLIDEIQQYGPVPRKWVPE